MITGASNTVIIGAIAIILAVLGCATALAITGHIDTVIVGTILTGTLTAAAGIIGAHIGGVTATKAAGAAQAVTAPATPAAPVAPTPATA